MRKFITPRGISEKDLAFFDVQNFPESLPLTLIAEGGGAAKISARELEAVAIKLAIDKYGLGAVADKVSATVNGLEVIVSLSS